MRSKVCLVFNYVLDVSFYRVIKRFFMDLSTQILEYLNAIPRGIQPQIEADYRVIFKK